MNAFHRSDLPAPAKALSLVRIHHGLPSRSGEEIQPVATGANAPAARIWGRGARLNHLVARRRRIALDRIPAGRCPAILELSGGTNFVILLGRDHESSDTFRVQFPDSREALVRGDRLREIYDGLCVFLTPSAAQQGGWLRHLWIRFAERR